VRDMIQLRVMLACPLLTVYLVTRHVNKSTNYISIIRQWSRGMNAAEVASGSNDKWEKGARLRLPRRGSTLRPCSE
jgi:hypothetical protein